MYEVEVNYGNYSQIHKFKKRLAMDNFLDLIKKRYTYKIIKG